MSDSASGLNKRFRSAIPETERRRGGGGGGADIKSIYS